MTFVMLAGYIRAKGTGGLGDTEVFRKHGKPAVTDRNRLHQLRFPHRSLIPLLFKTPAGPEKEAACDKDYQKYNRETSGPESSAAASAPVVSAGLLAPGTIIILTHR